MAVPQHLKTVEFVSVHHFDGTKSAISRPIPDTKTPPNLAEGALAKVSGNGPQQLRLGLGEMIGGHEGLAMYLVSDSALRLETP